VSAGVASVLTHAFSSKCGEMRIHASSVICMSPYNGMTGVFLKRRAKRLMLMRLLLKTLCGDEASPSSRNRQYGMTRSTQYFSDGRMWMSLSAHRAHWLAISAMTSSKPTILCRSTLMLDVMLFWVARNMPSSWFSMVDGSPGTTFMVPCSALHDEIEGEFEIDSD